MAEKTRWDGFLGPKQWMPIVGVLSVAVIALAVALVLNLGDDSGGATSGGTNQGKVPTHQHADFLVMIRGQKFDFNQPQFVSHADGKELSDFVHIHEPRYTVVHVHQTLTKWDDFFTSLGFTLNDPSFPGVDSARTCMTLPDKTKLCNTDTEKWKFIANGVPVDGMSNVYISDLSRVLFSYGPESVDQVLKEQWPQVTDQACIPSELCLNRIDPNEPPEECTGKGTCSK
ncbi:MAG: hypothetical protein ABI577_10795 [bacterium]